MRMNKLILTAMGLALGASLGWADGSLESAAAGASKALAKAAQARIAAPAGLAAASAAPEDPVVPLPTQTNPSVSPEQLRQLAAVAAAIYNKQGRPASSEWYCVNADDLKMTGRASDARRCIRVSGKAEGGNYRFMSAEMKLEVYGDAETRFFGVPTGGERVLVAADSCVVHGNGTVDGISGRKTFDNVSMPDLYDVIANEIIFWINYK